MDIKIHYSSSAGNLYQVDDLLIEAGASIKQIKKALNFKLSNISGCLVSHLHQDHSKGVRDLLKCGIDCYMNIETAKAMGQVGNFGHHRCHIIEPMKQFRVGSWIIKPFPLIHDVENYGFLISKGGEKLLYCSDTNYVPYRFKGLNFILLGINYDAEILKDNVAAGAIDIEVAKRILKNHMSLQTAIEFFKANDMSKIREIHLVHLSDGNSNADKFRTEIEKITGRPVYIGGE